ncbi:MULTISPECIES: hypothetical protein [unclassified Paenibacillus]|uniref:hypothetical protein n=1 Tax=unclassified Paenibacillus TaxID=185978 RepID=UPI001AEB040D|nr:MULTISPECIES: hypothetical protein [unclassified Paenibacillus]MBP1157371.1 hypothetical protein [Paenibacillus sp. PvP091]MBP1171891.1 hypothetical protein [Paenibacillus sp. PvR098]MBP2438272.1 hypothetical protein [Paenibacillus sp. PvP052]
MLRGTKELLYSTLGAVMLLAAGCANEPPAHPPAPTGTSSTDTTPSTEALAPKAEPDAPAAVDSPTDSVRGDTEAPPEAAKPAPKAPKSPSVPELPASSVLQEGGRTPASPKEPESKPKAPVMNIVDPPTVGAGPAMSDGERAAPMLPEPVAPPTVRSEPDDAAEPAVENVERDLWAPANISEPVRIEDDKDAPN